MARAALCDVIHVMDFQRLVTKKPRWLAGAKNKGTFLQPIESTEHCFYRRQLDACVYACTPSCFIVRGTDADVGNGTGFHAATHCLLTIVRDLKDPNSSGLQRTNKC